MDPLKESKEEPLFNNYNEISESFVEDGDIKEEETSDDGVESHFAMSSFFSPTRSEFPHSMAPEPMDRVKEEDIDQETESEKECNKKRKTKHVDQKHRNSGMAEADSEVENSVNQPLFINDEHAVRMIADVRESAVANIASPLWQILYADGIDTFEKESSVKEEIGWRDNGRPSMRAFDAVNYKYSLKGNNGSQGPVVKKSRLEYLSTPSRKPDAQVDSKIGTPGTAKTSDTDIECPECEFRTRNAKSWVNHLALQHHTTPLLAGFALLCECGNESYSAKHSRACNVANFTVICHSVGPLRRFDDAKDTPQCILCEKYPLTPLGYFRHLDRHHNTTPTANGIYLRCACDFKAFSISSIVKKHKNCDGRLFSLHKVDEE